MQQAYRNYEANLRDTVAAALRSGARVFVSTVATNLKDCGPFASLHRENLKPEGLASWTALVQKGEEVDSAHSYAEALNDYSQALKIDDQYAELEFRIARTFSEMGDYTDAKQHFQRARDLDTLRFRADSRINDINRESSRWGAELIDAESVLSQESPNGIIGSELVYEHVHMTPRGNYLLARELFEKIARQLASQGTQEAASPESAASVDAPSEADCERWLALTSHDRLRMANEMLQRLQKPPFTNQLNHSEQVLRLATVVDAPDENPNDTVEEYRWAIRRLPEDRILHYNFGLFLFDYNRAAAAQELRMSRPWDGFPVFAPDGTMM
jgi:tetratricopeptide (TPR) repeat protein